MFSVSSTFQCTFWSPTACCVHAGARPSLRNDVRWCDGHGMAWSSRCGHTARSRHSSAGFDPCFPLSTWLIYQKRLPHFAAPKHLCPLCSCVRSLELTGDRNSGDLRHLVPERLHSRRPCRPRLRQRSAGARHPRHRAVELPRLQGRAADAIATRSSSSASRRAAAAPSSTPCSRAPTTRSGCS